MAIDLVSLVVFWVAAYALVHSYFIYPLSLWAVSTVKTTSSVEGLESPHVTLIIAAYNEEEIIGEKIENSLELEYPDEKFSIVVFSDASDDQTDDIVREYADSGVELARIEGRVGKTACQNKVAERVESDILVFSDANSMYEPEAISELVGQFRPGVGCVVGELRYRESSNVEGESVYWRYESAIKRLESRVNSLVTGNGAIYAIRAESYVPLPRDAISDFAEPLEIVRNGELVKYAPKAVAWEDTDASSEAERSRRIRIVTRSWHTIADYGDLLNPVRHPIVSYQLWSHKILRWLSPVFLAGVFVANVGLVVTTGPGLYRVTLAGQVAFYVFAGFGGLSELFEIDSPLVTHVPFHFVQSNYGMLIGLWNFLKGSNIVVWETSAREGSEE